MHPNLDSFSEASSAVLAPDGNIWLTNPIRSTIVRVTPDGQSRTFTHGLTRWDSGPQYITAGPDKALWFTEQRDRIGRVSLDGKITEYSTGIPARASLGGIITGPDGNLWFTLYHGNVMGRISVHGHIRLYHNLVYPSQGTDRVSDAMIVRDRRGNIYWNEPQAGRIARLQISP